MESEKIRLQTAISLSERLMFFLQFLGRFLPTSEVALPNQPLVTYIWPGMDGKNGMTGLRVEEEEEAAAADGRDTRRRRRRSRQERSSQEEGRRKEGKKEVELKWENGGNAEISSKVHLAGRLPP